MISSSQLLSFKAIRGQSGSAERTALEEPIYFLSHPFSATSADLLWRRAGRMPQKARNGTEKEAGKKRIEKLLRCWETHLSALSLLLTHHFEELHPSCWPVNEASVQLKNSNFSPTLHYLEKPPCQVAVFSLPLPSPAGADTSTWLHQPPCWYLPCSGHCQGGRSGCHLLLLANIWSSVII